MKMYSDNNMISKRFAFKTGDGPELPGLHVVRFEGRERYANSSSFGSSWRRQTWRRWRRWTMR